MKRSLSLTVALAFLVLPHAHAASLSVVKTGTAYAVYLNGGADNGGFDTIAVNLTPTGSATFTNQTSGLVAGVPRPAGQAFSYPNRALGGDPLDGPPFLAWVILDPMNTPTRLSFDGGPLGQKISTASQPGENLFLANVNMPTGQGVANVKAISNGA